MFDVDKVQTGLTGLVGIRQPFNPAYQKIDVTNQGSRSGRFLNDIPTFKVEYFIDSQDYKDITDADLNSLLNQIQRASISSVCQSIFGDNSFIDRNLLYSFATSRTNQETTLQNGFIGWQIKPSRTKNVAFKITDVRLEFAGTGDLTIVLFNSSLNTPMFSKVVTITDTFQVETLDWVVNNTDGDYKGEYYLGYVYDGTLVPFKRDYENSSIRNYLSEVEFTEMYVPGGTDATLFDLNQIYEISENVGINPDVTIYEDYTDLILQNEHLFAHAVQLQYAIQIMNGYVASLRSNRNERIAKDAVLLTLQALEGSNDASPVNVVGLNTLLGREVAKIKKVIKDIRNGYFGEGIQVQTLG